MLLKSCDGLYFPSFFCIYLDGDIHSCIEGAAKNTLEMNSFTPTIVHEYIHFMQDVSTIYGLTNLCNSFAKVFNFYNMEEKEIKLPYRITKNINNERLNRDLFSIYFNHCDFKKIPKKDLSLSIKTKDGFEDIEDIDVFRKEFPDAELPLYNLEVTYAGVSQEYHFGASAIMEGMAKLIETHLFPPVEEERFYYAPYDLPYLVAKCIYPEFASNKSFIVALCDASLMFLHSSQLFIDSLTKMKNDRFMPKSSKEVYDYVYTHSIPNFDAQYNEAAKRAKHDIFNIVNANIDDYVVCRDWAVDAIESYANLRQTKMNFLSELLEKPAKDAVAVLYGIFRSNISPIIYDQKKNFAVVGSVSEKNKDKYTYWYCLKLFYEYIFLSADSGCPFSSFCKLENETCIEKPWTRELNGPPYCVFQQFYRMFGVYKRKIVN